MARLLNIPLLTDAWRMAVRYGDVLAPVTVFFGFINDAIMRVGGTGHAQQAAIISQLSQSSGGLQSLAAINTTIGTAHNPADSFISIGLLLLAASVELVILLGLTDTLIQRKGLRLNVLLRFFRHGLIGSLQGFWRGFFRFLLFSIALSVGILALLLMRGEVSFGALALVAIATLAVFIWMMWFLLPYIFATLDCVLHAKDFDSAFIRSEEALKGRYLEVLLTLGISTLPALLSNLLLAWLPESYGATVTIILTNLLMVPALVLLYLYARDFFAAPVSSTETTMSVNAE
ncbi:MAG: hypothetical protein K2Q12_07020 [Rickettsiales bacterium]|nr:hypothetical protein [Rickettsiales bacterium]